LAADRGAAFGAAIGGGGSGSNPGGVVLGFGGLKDMSAMNISGGDLMDQFTPGVGASGFGGSKPSCRFTSNSATFNPRIQFRKGKESVL